MWSIHQLYGYVVEITWNAHQILASFPGPKSVSGLETRLPNIMWAQSLWCHDAKGGGAQSLQVRHELLYVVLLEIWRWSWDKCIFLLLQSLILRMKDVGLVGLLVSTQCAVGVYHCQWCTSTRSSRSGEHNSVTLLKEQNISKVLLCGWWVQGIMKQPQGGANTLNMVHVDFLFFIVLWL